MKTLKVLLLLCLVSCLECWSQSTYYVTTSGAGKQDGSSWTDALNSDNFSDLFVSATSGTVFKMASGKYFPKRENLGYVTDKAFVIEGGYTVVDGEGTRDLSTLTESDMTILVGDVSSDASENQTIAITPTGKDALPTNISGVIFESSAKDTVFVLSNVGSGAEIVFSNGVVRRTSTIPCEEGEGSEYTATIIVGENTKFGVEGIDTVTFSVIGDRTVTLSARNTFGCMVTDVYNVTVLPKPQVIRDSANYYVKVEATGTGDGSSWANAMSNESFAFAFDKVENGSTFHFAAGTYTPVYSYDYEGENYLCFASDKCVNLRGGYGGNPSEGEKPNVGKNKAILKGVAYIPESDGDISVTGIDIAVTDAIAFFLSGEKGKVNLTMDSCDVNFFGARENLMDEAIGVSLKQVETTRISNCYIHYGTGYFGSIGVSCVDGRSLIVSSSFFSEVYSSIKTSGLSSVCIENSTINDFALVFSSDKTTLINNTIYNSSCIFEGQAQIVGNIIYSNFNIGDASVVSSYNIIIGDGLLSWESNNDILTTEVDLLSILEKDEAGQPLLADNGGFTSNIALLSDVLPDGQSIRFDRTGLTDVDVDQRGIVRPELTCMGAYEIGIVNKTITLNDTIVVAGSYEDLASGVTKVLAIGDTILNDTIRHGESTPDTFYVRKVTVLPKSTNHNYYVTVKGTQGGDGSSWAKAMSNDQFAFAFDKVEDGATFHFAEGTYYPVLYNEKSDAVRGESFYTTNLVNLQGGYPADVMDENAVPLPELYHATFTGKHFRDTIEVTSPNVVLYSLSKEGTVKVSGLAFEEASILPESSITFWDALLGFDAHVENVVFEVSNCSFKLADHTLFCSDSCSGTIRDCEFDGGRAVWGDGNGIAVESSTFKESNFSAKNFEDVTLYNNTFLVNALNYSYSTCVDLLNNKSLSLQNNTFLQRINIEGSDKAEMIGNIIMQLDGPSSISTKYNLYVDKESLNLDPSFTQNSFEGYSDSDISVNLEELQNLLEYKDEMFELKYNEGPTKTVALKSDILSDSTSIRFNRNGFTNVDVDQRGVSRPDSTCVGAYEIGLSKVIIYLTEIPVHAGEYQDNSYGSGKSVVVSVGPYVWRDTVYASLQGGIDTVYVRNLSVLANGEKKDDGFHYYVKTSGKGDGSSWEEAMSTEAFEYMFDKVDDGATFHFAAGRYTPTNKMTGFWTDKCVNLVGGYPANPSKGEMPRPGDEDTKVVIADVYEGINFAPIKGGTIHVSGFDFGMKGVNTSTPLLVNGGKGDVKLVLDSCTFLNNMNAMILDTVSVTIKDCNFIDNYYAIEGKPLKDLTIESSFIEPTSGDLCSKFESVKITNSTVNGSLNVYDFNSLSLVNNTILGSCGILPGGTAEISFTGNIFCGDFNLGEEELSIESSHNLYRDNANASWMSGTDLIATKDQLYSLLSFDVENEIAILSDTDSYTKVVALLADTLSDGNSIRFNRQGVTDVVVDQRGYARADSTCMGAYELALSTRIINLADTTVTPGDYLDPYGLSAEGLTIGELVLTDTIPGASDNEPDIIYTRKVTVLPQAYEDDQKALHYYVKQNGDGTGDGSSWRNAMSAQDFAFALNKVEDNATFHIAEGTYNPVFSAPGLTDLDNVSSKAFFTDHSVNLIGGYSKEEVSLSAVPNSLHETIFEGAEDASRTSIHVLMFNPTETGKKLSCKYINFKHVVSYRSMDGLVNANLTSGLSAICEFDSCRFSDAWCGIRTINCAATIRNCQFILSNNSNAISIEGNSSDTVKIESSYVKGGVNIAEHFYHIVNSTLENVSINSVVSVSKTGYVDNSTIGTFVAGADRIHVLRASIIYSDLKLVGDANIMSYNNIYPADDADIASIQCQGDLLLSVDEMKYIMAHDENSFLAEDNGGFTYTIALISDTLSSGASIRYEKKNPMLKLDVDQRGVYRPDETCRGAYEFGCLPTSVTYEGQFVDYNGEEAPGWHSDTTVVVDAGGCTHETIRSYVVLPPELPEYYVKTVSKGLGDGSSWDNAMGSDAFQLSLLYSKDPKTYYVAEGEYVAMFDTLGHVPANEESRCFYTNKSVTIIGGYSSIATEGYKQNLSQNPTIFSAGEGRSVKNLFVANVSADENISLSGIVFNGASSDPECKCEAITVNPKREVSNVTVDITNCTVKNAYLGISLSYCSGHVAGCNFFDNSVCGLRIDANQGLSPIYVDSSYFTGNAHGLNVCSGSDFYLTNSTFVGNTTAMDVSKGEFAKYLMSYNTILDSVYVNIGNSLLVWKGNIFGSIVTKNESFASFSMTSSFNVYLNENILPEISESDMVLDRRDLNSLFDLDAQGNVSVMKGTGFTSYAPLKSDRLSSGESIRFVRFSETDVDQRGVSRMPMTVMGAYELLCKYDTIVAGQTLFGKLFESFGIYELNRLDTMASGVEMVKHIIFVKPSPAPQDYYVKYDGDGAKSGMSWKNAMSREEFAWVFPMVADHSTFHIAAGVYQPIYDMNADSVPDNVSTKEFYSEHLVNIQGGYHGDAKDGDLPDPLNSETVLSGYRKNKNGEEEVYYNVLRIVSKKSGEMSVSGVIFESYTDSMVGNAIVIDANKNDVTLNVSQSTVRNFNQGIVADSCSLVLSECYFTDDNTAVVSSGNRLGKIEVSSSTFNGVETAVKCGASSYDLIVTNSTFKDCNGSAISYVSSKLGTCKFTNNTVLSPVQVSSNLNFECVGNIFSSNFRIHKDGDQPLKYVSSYNMYWNDPDKQNEATLGQYSNESDIWASYDQFREILESNSNGSFILNDNGGYAMTVAIVADTLEGVGSIRFPKSNTTVTTDQRGIKRKRNTCRGAYELDRFIPLDIPSAFTPYSLDGLNDVFMPEYEVYIYDRYGRLISHSMDGWDGTYDGGDLADPGVYVYVLLDPEGEVRKGTIDILKAK